MSGGDGDRWGQTLFSCLSLKGHIHTFFSGISFHLEENNSLGPGAERCSRGRCGKVRDSGVWALESTTKAKGVRGEAEMPGPGVGRAARPPWKSDLGLGFSVQPAAVPSGLHPFRPGSILTEAARRRLAFCSLSLRVADVMSGAVCLPGATPTTLKLERVRKYPPNKK